MQKSLLLLLFALTLILILFVIVQADSTSPRPPPQCYHHNCWTYDDDTTVCEWEVEDCDGRAAEFPAV